MSKHRNAKGSLAYAWVELGGESYAIVPVAVLAGLCRQAGMVAVPRGAGVPSALDVAAPEEMSGANVARRIADRRKRAGLTQGELAQRAGGRIETVNRIERGRVMPDFGTIRKLVEAMLEVERQFATNEHE
jgi:DNA-binding XRE family transcriptional regulator